MGILDLYVSSTPHETHSPLAEYWRGFGSRERVWWMRGDGVMRVRNQALDESNKFLENKDRAGQAQ